MSARDALRRIQHYVAMRRAKPFLGLGDNVHNIHTGTEWEAELLFSDLCAVADAGAALATEDRAESELVGMLEKIEQQLDYGQLHDAHQIVLGALAKHAKE